MSIEEHREIERAIQVTFDAGIWLGIVFGIWLGALVVRPGIDLLATVLHRFVMRFRWRRDFEAWVIRLARREARKRRTRA